MDRNEVERLVAGVAADRGRRTPPSGFPRLPPLPAGRYADPAFLTLERDFLWRRAWLYAAHVDELPHVGSYLRWSRNGAPIVVLRGRDEKIRAFYNTCQHRGAPLVRADRGALRGHLSCGYHGWSYDLEGTLVGVPDEVDFGALDRSCLGLRKVRCERFGNWIFLNEAPDASPLLDDLAPIRRAWGHLPLEKLRLVHRRAWRVACQLKVLLENFLEAYHFRLLHQNTVDRFLDRQGTHIVLWERGHSLMLTPNRRADWVDPGAIGMPEMEGATEIERSHNPSYNVFPNWIAPIAASGIPSVAMWPRGERESELEVIWFAPEWEGGAPDRWEQRIANFDRIVEEDVQFAEAIQESIDSPGFRGVPLSYQERRIYHWHEELDRRIGRDRIPPSLRVEPLLEPWTHYAASVRTR